MRGQGLAVSANCYDDLARAMAASVPPRRVVLHCDDLSARTLWHAVGLGVGQYIVGSQEQVETLSACAEHRPLVVVDVSDEPDEETVQAMLGDPDLDVTGLHSELDRVDTVDDMIALMAQMRYHRGVLMTRLSVAVSGIDHRSIEAIASQLEDTVEGGCARFRYPRPTIQVCPDWLALTREI